MHPGVKFRLRHGETILMVGNSDDYHFVSKVSAPDGTWFPAYTLPSGIALDMQPVMLEDWQEVSASISGLCIECLVILNSGPGIVRTQPGVAPIESPRELWEASQRGYVLAEREGGASVGGAAVTTISGIPLCMQHGITVYRAVSRYPNHPGTPPAERPNSPALHSAASPGPNSAREPYPRSQGAPA